MNSLHFDQKIIRCELTFLYILYIFLTYPIFLKKKKKKKKNVNYHLLIKAFLFKNLKYFNY